MEPSALTLLPSLAAAAALALAIRGELAARGLRARLLKVEERKAVSEREAYRYTQLFDATREIDSLPNISQNYFQKDGSGRLPEGGELFNQSVEISTERHAMIKGIFNRVRPLLDADLRSTANGALQEEERQSNRLTHALYTHSPPPKGIDFTTLIEARREAEHKVKSVLRRQVERLTDEGPGTSR